MNITELRNEMRDMGFEDNQIFQDTMFNDTFYSSVTRALKIIATTVKAPIAGYTLEYSVLFANNLQAQMTAHGKTKADLVSDLGFKMSDVESWLDGKTIPSTDTIKILAEYFGVPVTDLYSGRYDLSELTKNANNEATFDSIDRVVKNTSKGVDTFADWDIVEGKILITDPQQIKYIYEVEGNTVTVYYKQRIPQITSETTTLPIEYSCEPLLSLLSAYYIWLDDDERKAVMYYNEFDSMKQEILADVLKPKARIVWHS